MKKTNVNTTNYQTISELYRKTAIKFENYVGLPSIAARHTSIEFNKYIQLDAGFVPKEIGLQKQLILITHFHSDHSCDLMNCIDNDHVVTIFTPSCSALNLFMKIKYELMMQKGRKYSDIDITKKVRIIGCKRANGEFENQNEIITDEGVSIELVNMGDKVIIDIQGREQVAVEPFACYHTVDTCGYVIYSKTNRLKNVLSFDETMTFDVNLSEDQTGHSNFDDITEFSKRHNVDIDVELIEERKNDKFILKIRRLNIKNSVNINTKDENGKCVLNPKDFSFLKKYKIDITDDFLDPHTMFFGDTCSYVFDSESVGYNRVMELMRDVKTIIIESTYLESIDEMSKQEYAQRKKNKHMFIFELEKMFEMFPNTKFLLIHFSACYTYEQIKTKINAMNRKYKNVFGFF